MRRLLTVACLASLSACTWVPMDAGGGAVRVALDRQDLSVCEKRGEVVVTVKDRLGPLQRNALKVRDELETLARNEAPDMGGDTVQARGEPRAGEQRWAVFRCGSAALPATTRAPSQPTDEHEAETYPIED